MNTDLPCLNCGDITHRDSMAFAKGNEARHGHICTVCYHKLPRDLRGAYSEPLLPLKRKLPDNAAKIHTEQLTITYRAEPQSIEVNIVGVGVAYWTPEDGIIDQGFEFLSNAPEALRSHIGEVCARLFFGLPLKPE